MPKKKYIKRKGRNITAVPLNLKTEGFTYEKWGGKQDCKAGDWLVDNDGEFYTIDANTFQKTYEEVSPGRYKKTSIVWAERADHSGVLKTKEGTSQYDVGDYLVSNVEDESDTWCVTAQKFRDMYEPVD